MIFSNPEQSLFISGEEKACLILNSGLLHFSSRALGAEANARQHNPSPPPLRWKVEQHLKVTILAFATSPALNTQHLQQGEGGRGDLVSFKKESFSLENLSSSLKALKKENSHAFDFLWSKGNPNFSFDKTAITLFSSYFDQLSALKNQFLREDRKTKKPKTVLSTPLVVTGHSVGGSIASLFTLLLLGSISQPQDELPICITFGSPFLGDKGLQGAISQYSKWNSCFVHVVANKDPVLKLFVPQRTSQPFGTFGSFGSPSPPTTTQRQPFGAYFLCSEKGYTCVEDLVVISELLVTMGSERIRNEILSQEFSMEHYGSLVQDLSSKVVVKEDPKLDSSVTQPLRAGIILQLKAIGDERPLQEKENIIRKLTEREIMLLLKKTAVNPLKKLNDVKIKMAYLEWYKRQCRAKEVGYYDSYKSLYTFSDREVTKHKKFLNDYWKKTVEEAEKKPQKEGAYIRSTWLFAGTNYRRMVEPLDIAEYYRVDGNRDYVNNKRSKRYKVLEQWAKEEAGETTQPPSQKKKQNVAELLTEDSCFWAKVEEARVACKSYKESPINDPQKHESEVLLINFDKYVMEEIDKCALSPEIFLEQSSFMRWWKEYEAIIGGYNSPLVDFMKNGKYNQYASGFSETVILHTAKAASQILVHVKRPEVTQRERIMSSRSPLSSVSGKLSASTSSVSFSLDYEKPVGFEIPLMEIKAKLIVEGVLRVVVSGPGGCGKTTLATAICHDQQVKDKFKGNIWFFTLSEGPDLRDIVHKLFYQIAGGVPQFSDDEKKMLDELEEKLKEKENEPRLLVLDDAWPGSEDLLWKLNFEIKNYHILVTSRYTFPGFGFTYKLQPLNEEDAITLLRQSAELQSNGNSPSPARKHMRQIVKSCQGFPLFISVIGRSLVGMEAVDWSVKATQCSDGSILKKEDELRACLQSSVDALDDEIKNCFMDLGSFHADQRIPANTLVDMWVELHKLQEDGAMAYLFKLSHLNLVDIIVISNYTSEEDEFYNQHFIKQYHLMRELVVTNCASDPIEKRKRLFLDLRGGKVPEWWEEQKHISITANLLSISTDKSFAYGWCDLQATEVEVLVLNLQSENYVFLPEFMGKMAKLRVLIVRNDGRFPAELDKISLLASLSNLKRVRLENISFPTSLSTSMQMQNLEKISLVTCKNVQALPLSDALFPNLREVNIACCNDLMELPPGFCDLVLLNKLSITNCHNLVALPKEIGNLVKLKVLRLNSCIELSELPDTIGNLHDLDVLDISNCLSIKTLPQQIGDLRRLRKLCMFDCSGCELPPSVTKLQNLDEVIGDEETINSWKQYKYSLPKLQVKIVKSCQGESAAAGLSKDVEKREKTSLIDESEGFYVREADKEATADVLTRNNSLLMILDDDNGSNPGVRVRGRGLRETIADKGATSSDKADGPDAELMTESSTGDEDMPGETKEVVQKISSSSSSFGSSISRKTSSSSLLKSPFGLYRSISFRFLVPVLLAALLFQATLLAYIAISPKIQEHDVFLSFNGEDPSDEELLLISTQLHGALHQACIGAFMGFKEKRREVLKAIDGSRVAVIILSQGYASCRRCLEELEMIIEGHRGAHGKTVVPILYKVSQQDLMQQNEEFAKGYVMREENVKHLDKVYSWRYALRQAINLPGGWDYSSYSSESELISNVVQDIAAKLRTETESSSTATTGEVAELWVQDFRLLVFSMLITAIAIALQEREESCDYDVFVNYSGELTLVSKLSHYLEGKNIRTFKDEGFVRRKHITSKIRKAIQRSKVAILILSRGYPNSPCCLDELVEIIECHLKKGLAIVPVCYNVQQSFLANSIRNLHFESRRRMPSWEQALKEAAAMTGWIHSKPEDDFEVLLGEIYKEVERKLGKMVETDLAGTRNRNMIPSLWGLLPLLLVLLLLPLLLLLLLPPTPLSIHIFSSLFGASFISLILWYVVRIGKFIYQGEKLNA